MSSLSFAEDLNWNALEWDRAAEELTWERVKKSFPLILLPSVCGGATQLGHEAKKQNISLLSKWNIKEYFISSFIWPFDTPHPPFVEIAFMKKGKSRIGKFICPSRIILTLFSV